MKYCFFIAPLFFASQLFSEEAQTTMPHDQGFGQTMIMIAIALTFFYVILWRPENKRRKMIEDKKKAMKKGDKVSVMGILGVVSQIKERTIVIRLIEGAKMEVMKEAIGDVQPGDEE